MAGSKHVDDLRFTSPEELANWLDSLYECYPDGAVGNKKWEAAQVAAQAVRGMSAQQRFVQLPPDWKREGIVVIADALTGRLLGCMGHNTWDAQVRADTAQGGDAKAIISALSDEKAGTVDYVRVGTLNIQRWRGVDSMINTDFDYAGDLPDGTYPIFAASTTPDKE